MSTLAPILPVIACFAAIDYLVVALARRAREEDRGRFESNPRSRAVPARTPVRPRIPPTCSTGSPVIFGGAKPVPVNLTRLRRPRRGWALVGAAGPGSNVVIASSLCLLLSLLRHGGVLGPASAGTEILAIGVFANILLAVFNLIPIPPLDGSRLLQYILTDAQLDGYRRLEPYGLLVIFGLVFFVPGFTMLVADGVFACAALLGAVFGVSAELASVLGGPSRLSS